ncbi:MAG: flavin-containing monooxygenase [Gammaproteobacteria bacterium]
MRIAIVGAGISAIAFAHVLERFGHSCVLFEKADTIGGIWALAYPGVSLQNSREQYHFADLPWPHQPDQHPTAGQILDYLDTAVERFGLDVRTGHEVTVMRETTRGWALEVSHRGATATTEFDYAVLSVGQYAEGKHRPDFPGADDFAGDVLTERDVRSTALFDGRRVAVVGFGKSAVDMASFAAHSAAAVSHVFRTPRWLIPFDLLGTHYTYLLFSRASTTFMPSWVHSGRVERWLHARVPALAAGFWRTVGGLVARHIRAQARPGDAQAAARLALVTPTHGFAQDLRSATAMAPRDYFPRVAAGSIVPARGEIAGYTRDGLRLGDGREIPADLVVLATGSGSPRFPFLPARFRELLESEPDGVQLYRHVLHPSVPRLAFAGYNHCFMHVPAAEVGALWLGAVLRGDLELPPAAEQLASIERIRAWKREHITFEPSRACAVSTRFQQYLDAMLRELGLSPYRKLPNVFAEGFMRYGAADYAGLVDDYLARPAPSPRACLDLDA